MAQTVRTGSFGPLLGSCAGLEGSLTHVAVSSPSVRSPFLLLHPASIPGDMLVDIAYQHTAITQALCYEGHTKNFFNQTKSGTFVRITDSAYRHRCVSSRSQIQIVSCTEISVILL